MATPNEQVTIVFDHFKVKADNANVTGGAYGWEFGIFKKSAMLIHWMCELLTYIFWLLLVQLHAPKIGWRFIYYFVMVMIVLLAAIVAIQHQGRLKAQEVLLEYVYIFTPMLKMCPVVSRVDMCSKWPNQWQVMMIGFLKSHLLWFAYR